MTVSMVDHFQPYQKKQIPQQVRASAHYPIYITSTPVGRKLFAQVHATVTWEMHSQHPCNLKLPGPCV
jgi:hypothetical protein